MLPTGFKRSTGVTSNRHSTNVTVPNWKHFVEHGSIFQGEHPLPLTSALFTHERLHLSVLPYGPDDRMPTPW